MADMMAANLVELSSIDGVSDTHSIWFDKAGSRGSRVVCAPFCCFPWWTCQWHLPSVYANSFQSLTGRHLS